MKCRVFTLLCCVAAVAQAESVTYQQQVKPLFDRYCVECHSGWFPKGGLRLDSLENIYQGGANNAVLFAGEPEKGTLVNFIRVVPGRFSIMPPGPAALDATQFELIQQWIEQGAR